VASLTLPRAVSWTGAVGGSAGWACGLQDDTVTCRLDEIPGRTPDGPASVDLVVRLVADTAAQRAAGLEAVLTVTAAEGLPAHTVAVPVRVGPSAPEGRPDDGGGAEPGGAGTVRGDREPGGPGPQ
jgi:hypothetical protein